MLISIPRACSFLDHDNFEFSGLDPRHRGEIAFDLAEKFVATRYQVPGKSTAEDLNYRSRTLRDLARGSSEAAAMDGSDFAERERWRRGLKRQAPFAEVAQFRMHLFRDVYICTQEPL